MTEFINKESEVYKRRQAEQELRRKYKERALELYSGTNIHITLTSTPVVHETGAFIDAVVFVPKNQLDGPNWDEKTVNLDNLKQNIKDLIK